VHYDLSIFAQAFASIWCKLQPSEIPWAQLKSTIADWPISDLQPFVGNQPPQGISNIMLDTVENL